MILVVGPTGLLGLEICRQLRQRGHPIRALVREGSEREKVLIELGAEIARGDLKEPLSLQRATQRVETVVSTATCTSSRRSGDTLRSVDRDGQLALLRAARQAGARRFVYVSLSPNSPPIEFVRFKQEVEAAVRASGLEWVNLQPSAFMEVWLSPLLGWDLPRGRARIIGPGDQPVSYVSIRDVLVGGPEALAPVDVVRRCEQIAGRRFHVQHVPPRLLSAVATLLAPFAPIQSNLIRLGLHHAAAGDTVDMARLSDELPQPLTSLERFVREALRGRD